jgi:hypothetical protein
MAAQSNLIESKLISQSNFSLSGMEFLRRHGARRVREFAPQPELLTDSNPLAKDEEKVDLDYERPSCDWAPLPLPCEYPHDWAQGPQRFVDGKDVGRTIAWLQSEDGFPVPIRLAEVGAIALRVMDNGRGQKELRREWDKVERVVAFMADLFPWHEVEEFAYALQGTGFRLLPVYAGDDENEGPLNFFDFESMRKRAGDSSKNEMLRLEREALGQDNATPSLVDGSLETHSAGFGQSDPVVGLVKTHSRNYLNAEGWRTYYQLEPCQRTPAFCVPGRQRRALDVISWYVRLDGARGELPNYGVVRVEVPKPFFEDNGKDWTYLDRVSKLICNYRCRDAGYGRAAISIHPIQRAEESLGSLFTQSDTLISRFYHLTGL